MSKHWEQGIWDTWGIEASLTALEGEYDLNFRAEGVDGAKWVVKVMRVDCDARFVDMQCKVLAHIQRASQTVNVPTVVLSKNKQAYEQLVSEDGSARLVWVLSFIEGVNYAQCAPKSLPLIEHLGESIADMHRALDGFTHDYLARDFKWNLLQAGWIEQHLGVVDNPEREALLRLILNTYNTKLDDVHALASMAIHNDINDYNLLVNMQMFERSTVSGIVDFGDMCLAPRVCDLAIAGAYIMLDHAQPEQALCSLVAAYHAVQPLTTAEIDVLYPLLQARLAVSVVNSTIEAIANPNDPYIVVSQAPAWRLLENTDVVHALITPRLRVACGFPVSNAAANVQRYLEKTVCGNCAAVLEQPLSNAPCHALSVASSSVPQNPFDLQRAEASAIGTDVYSEDEVWLGFYNEPRLIYTDLAFRKGRFKASNRRTVHLGIDVFAPATTTIRAPLDAVVSVVSNRPTHLDYGGMVILSHTIPSGEAFYSLYGHLNPDVCDLLKVGQKIKAGEAFATLGNPEQNGGWTPHLHLQLAMGTDGLEADWPGVADADEIQFWNAMCPNPAVLLNLPDEKVSHQPIDESQIRNMRDEDFSANLKLSYEKPVMFLRGWRHYLFDQWGRPYLDVYNNVPHVGHAHPKIQSVVSEQLKRLNTNTRYLNPAQSAFAKTLKQKLPEHLSVCYFVNSGSEANELALRLSRAHTKGHDMITPDHGYHGNTTGAIDISAYKFNAPGGVGQPDWVQLIDIPDTYAGTYREPDSNCAELYANQVDTAIEKITRCGGKLAGFIAETFPSVGGQVIPPDGYLKKVYEKIRGAGGVCIADEVQTGLGRLGDFYFAFEQQGVVPDIVVLGKPIGNGHPIGVVVTTQKIADDFAQGPEYFSTFGGSTLSCVVGKTVLDIVDDEALQSNAALRGKQLLDGLKALQGRHDVIGAVRGLGLFIGMVLVTNQTDRTPATHIAKYVVNRLKDHRILAGLEGPDNNILKIRPPLTIDSDDIEQLIVTLDQVLNDTVARC